MNEFDPEDAVEEFIERDSSMGSGYDRRWEVPHMIYSCPELGGFEGGHLAVGEDIPEKYQDANEIYAVIVTKEG